MKELLNQHPAPPNPLGLFLISKDCNTDSGVFHRCLKENNNIDSTSKFIDYIIPRLKMHHISDDAYNRKKELIDSLKIRNLSTEIPIYPKNKSTQKGNFAEIFLAEYIQETTSTNMPIYRFRYNTNIEQSMKGDDVLLFDLDSNPIRIIVGESKFRGTPSKKAVIDIVDGLKRSSSSELPVSLNFVADRLFENGEVEMGQKVLDCTILLVTNKIQIEYVGFLMSKTNVSDYVNSHTPDDLHNLLMISLGMDSPNNIIEEAFLKLEESI